MFEIFVTVDKHQGFKSLTVEWHLPGLKIRPATLKMRLLIISKLLTISSKYGLRSSESQYSCASVYWTTKRQWSTKPHGFCWIFFSSIWWITDDML